jgi:2Fe-2S ferredoxin
MTNLKFMTADGTEYAVDAPDGISIMQVGLDASVPGIRGDCGGNLSCATCHGHISASWRAKLAPPTEDELLMLDCALDQTDDSRLTCQIIVRNAIEGMVISVPENYL